MTKYFFWNFCKNNKIPYPESTLDIREVSKLNTSDVIIRKRFSFSGIGSTVKNVNKIVGLDEGGIISEYMKKSDDFGLILERDAFHIYKTTIDQRNQFKGIESYGVNHLLDQVAKYIPSLRKLSQYGNYPFQIDGFLSNQNIFFHELNYRNSLGQVFSYIIRHYFPDRAGRVLVEPFQIYQKKILNLEDVVPLTPLSGKYEYRFGLTLELKDKN